MKLFVAVEIFFGVLQSGLGLDDRWNLIDASELILRRLETQDGKFLR